MEYPSEPSPAAVKYGVTELRKVDWAAFCATIPSASALNAVSVAILVPAPNSANALLTAACPAKELAAVALENVPGNHPAIVLLMVSAMPDVHDPGMRLLTPERSLIPPTPPPEALTIFPVAESYASAVPPTPKTLPRAPMT